MRKTYILLLLILTTAAGVITSCKKGEDDPFISFRSRKARIAGEWKLMSGKGVKTESGPGAEYFSWTQEGDSYVQVDSNGTTAYKHVATYILEKNGEFSFTDVVDGKPFRTKGRWDFEEGIGDAKKKSRIILFYSQYEAPTLGTFFFSSNSVDESWSLKELRHKKMVWSRQVSYSYPDGLTGSIEEEMVFEPK